MTHRTTFALDEATAKRLKRLAVAWKVSQAEVVRRSVEQAEQAKAGARPDPITLLKQLHADGNGMDKAQDRKPVAVIAVEVGISTATLYNWRKDAHRQGCLLPARPGGNKCQSAEFYRKYRDSPIPLAAHTTRFRNYHFIIITYIVGMPTRPGGKPTRLRL